MVHVFLCPYCELLGSFHTSISKKKLTAYSKRGNKVDGGSMHGDDLTTIVFLYSYHNSYNRYLPACIHNIMGSDDTGGTVTLHARSSKPSRIVHPFVFLGDGQ